MLDILERICTGQGKNEDIEQLERLARTVQKSSLCGLGKTLHKTRILLLGDLGRPGQELLMRRYPYLDADIVVTGLPEKGEPMCNGLIAITHPKRTIVADAEFPANKRASQALRERLENAGAKPVFTRDHGAITIIIRPEAVEMSAATDGK